MNGPHDLGGQMGFGPVAPEPEATEPQFHAEWESRALALTLAAGALGHWSIDRSRHVRESHPPATYYSSSYYEIWTRALETLLIDAGLVDHDELRAGRALHEPATTNRPPLMPAQVAPMLAAGSPYTREPAAPPRFTAGQRVRAVNDHLTGHTRLPRYVRGRSGVVEAVRDCYVFPDSNAVGDPDPQWCYTVVFEATELWGRSADPTTTVSVDAFEPYLEEIA